MSKDYFVLRAGRVVYGPGNYDIEGARRVAKAELRAHPKATVKIVKLVEEYEAPGPDVDATGDADKN